MTTITCDHCNEKYRIVEDVVSKIKVRANCKTCGKQFYPGLADLFSASVSNSGAFRSDGMSSSPDISLSPPAPREGEFIGVTKVTWFNSIQARMSVILVLITTAVFCAFVFYNHASTKSRMQDELNTFAEISGTRLSRSLVEPVWSLDETQIEESLNSEMLDKRVLAICIKDRDGMSIISGKMRNNQGQVVNSNKSIDGDYIETKKSLRKNDGNIGYVEVYLTSRYMKEALNKSVINLVITAIVLNIAILVSVVLFLKKMIAQPIIELTEVADRMSMGDLNVEIAVRSKSEIGLLSEAIRRMQTSLRLALERLRRRP